MQCECLTLHGEKLQKKRLLTASQKLVFHEGTTAADVVSADDFVINTELVMTDDEILFDMLDQNDHATEEGDNDTSYIQPSCPKHWKSCVSICSSVKMLNVYTDVSIK